MRIAITFIFCLYLAAAHSQHYPFENKGLLVVKVVLEKSNDQINILRPILSYFDEDNNQVKRSFQMNSKETNDFLREKGVYDVSTLHFDFAKNYFVVLIPMDKIEKSTIHLEDEQGKRFGKVYPVTQEMVFDLHKNYQDNWGDFRKDYTPKPLNGFNHLITLKTSEIEIPQHLLFEEIGNKLNIKYDYKDKVIFRNKEDLNEVIDIKVEGLKIDFSKKIVIFQRFRGDCKMRINLFKIVDSKEKTITLKAYDYDGRCRAGGSVSILYMLDKPAVDTQLLFEKVLVND